VRSSTDFTASDRCETAVAARHPTLRHAAERRPLRRLARATGGCDIPAVTGSCRGLFQ
jgi:hypothetical protein